MPGLYRLKVRIYEIEEILVYFLRMEKRKMTIAFIFQFVFQQQFCGCWNSSWIQIEWLRLPDEGLKIHYLFFGLICSIKVFLLVADKPIWCFWYRLLLTETAITGGWVSRHAAKRTHGFPTSSRRKYVFPIQRSLLQEIKVSFSCP